MRKKHIIFKYDNCEFTSSSGVDLKIHTTKSHVKSSHGEKKNTSIHTQYEYKCDKCDSSSHIRDDITKHIKIVTVHQLSHYDNI